MNQRSPIKSLLLTAIIVAVVAVVVLTRPRIYNFQGQIMGTSYTVKYVATPFIKPVDEIAPIVHEALADVDRRMSTYKADSELMQFNRAPVGEVVTVSADIVDLVQQAAKLSTLSDGAYDVTIGPLVNLWGFGPSKLNANSGSGDLNDPHQMMAWIEASLGQQVPSDEAIAHAKAQVGYQALLVDDAASTLTKTKPMFVDLSSIAKGYGVDQAANALNALGIDSYMVEVGGEVMVHGDKPNGEPWRLAVIGPQMDAGKASALVQPLNKGLATSGDYLNYFEVDGKRYSHTINPKSGWPEALRIAEVAVIADTTAEADALATMFMVLGDERGIALANREGIAARFAFYTDNGYDTVTSDAFKPYLVKE